MKSDLLQPSFNADSKSNIIFAFNSLDFLNNIPSKCFWRNHFAFQ